jgi:hypothetical protein
MIDLVEKFFLDSASPGVFRTFALLLWQLTGCIDNGWLKVFGVFLNMVSFT